MQAIMTDAYNLPVLQVNEREEDQIKVSARVKKGEFSKFLISICSDKAFQELSFKKNSTKKIFFQCKVIGR